MPQVECRGCGIMISPDHIGEVAYEFGDYKICSYCLKQLRKRGHLQVLPYRANLHLHSDGSIGDLGSEGNESE